MKFASVCLKSYLKKWFNDGKNTLTDFWQKWREVKKTHIGRLMFISFGVFFCRILVLSNGEVKEFDSPSTLLQDQSSIFYSMAKDAGIV